MSNNYKDRNSIKIPLIENSATVKVYKDRINIDTQKISSDEYITKTKWFYDLCYSVNDLNNENELSVLSQLVDKTFDCAIITTCSTSKNIFDDVEINLSLRHNGWLSSTDHIDQSLLQVQDKNNFNQLLAKFVTLIIFQIIDYYIRELDYRSSVIEDGRRVILRREDSSLSDIGEGSLQLILESLSILPAFDDQNQRSKTLFKWELYPYTYSASTSLVTKYLVENDNLSYLQVINEEIKLVITLMILILLLGYV